jgi:hypothetical protein
MSHNHRNVSRSALTHQVKADPKAAQARRITTDTRPQWSWITEHDQVVAACLAILQGKPALYPVFGIQLHVEIRHGNEEDFPVLVYFDAKYGDEGQNLCGKLREGHWIGTSTLLRNPKNITFRNIQDELFTFTILAQPEMQEALAVYREEANHQRQAQEAEQRELLNNLRSRVLPSAAPVATAVKLVVQPEPTEKKAKPFYPGFTKLADILGDSIGVFNHPSGVTIKVCNHPFGLTVRANTRDENHPVYAFAKGNQFLRQVDVAKGSFEPYPGENFVFEKEQFMDWIHEQLEREAAGNMPAAAPEVVTIGQQPVEVAQAPATPTTTASVDVEKVFGVAATSGVAKDAKRGVPAKRAPKARAKKVAGEAVIA